MQDGIIGQTGRKLKIRMKEHEADSKLDIRNKLVKKRKDQSSVFSTYSMCVILLCATLLDNPKL